MVETASADPKPACMKMMRNLSQLSRHHFSSVEELQQCCGYCYVHEHECHLSSVRDDLHIAGFPCSPFSTQRPESFKSKGWRQQHDAVVMTEVAKDIQRLEPYLVVLENVRGFHEQPPRVARTVCA